MLLFRRGQRTPIAAVANYRAVPLDQSLELSKVHFRPPFDAPPDIADGHPVEVPLCAGLAVVDALIRSQVVIIGKPSPIRGQRTLEAI